VYPRGESKKFNVARGESKEKKNYREKNKTLPHYRGISNIFILKFITKLKFDIILIIYVKNLALYRKIIQTPIRPSEHFGLPPPLR
jgi:hypothetical protein